MISGGFARGRRGARVGQARVIIVGGDRNRVVGWMVVGAGLLLGCSGCVCPGAGNCAVVPDDCSPRCGQTACPSRRTTCSVEGPPSAGVRETACPVGPSGRPRLCRACGWRGRPPKKRVEPAHYMHPRFHPVPVQPVFSRHTGQSSVVPSDGVPAEVTPPIPEEIVPPEPEPIERGASQPGPGGQEDQVTRTPRRLPGSSGSSGWMLSRSPADEKGPALGARSNTKGRTIKQRVRLVKP